MPEFLRFQMDIAGVRRSYQAIGAGLADTRKPLRIFGRYLAKKYLAKIRSGGDGGWAPLAEGTKKNLSQGKTTGGGSIRAIRKLQRIEGGLKKRIREARAKGENRGQKYRALTGALEDLQKTLAAARAERAAKHAAAAAPPDPLVDLVVVSERGRARVRITTPGYSAAKNVSFPRHLRQEGRTFQVPASAISSHRAGHYVVKPSAVGVVRSHKKTAVDRHRFYGRLGWFRAKVESNTLTIAMPPVDWLWRLHYGDGPIPARPVMPDELDQQDVDTLIEVAGEHMIHIWETTP